MPGVKPHGNETESDENRELDVDIDKEYPVGATLVLGDLIPPEGLPVPEVREAEVAEEVEETPAGAEEPAEEEVTEEAPAEETAEDTPAEPELEKPAPKTNDLTRVLYVILQFTWGILQNICGVLTRLVVLIRCGKDAKMGCFHGAVMTRWKKTHSMGLGMFIFYGHGDAPDAENIKSHEFGHTVQSAWLGPLFLPVIGIPSYVWAMLPVFVKKRKEQGIKYCSFYPESWANKLGEKITGIPGPDR